MVATVHVLPVPSAPPPEAPRAKLTPPCDARTAHLCPVCGEELTYRKCEALCTSRTCVHRLVLSCSDS